MKYSVTLVFLALSFVGLSQIRAFDHLEHLYDQGHYKKVHRKSSKLLNNPEYDFSTVPAYYKAISSFQLMINQRWKNRSQRNFEEGLALYSKFRTEDVNQRIYAAHLNELSFLRRDLYAWLEQNEGNNKDNIERNVKILLNEHLREVELPKQEVTPIEPTHKPDIITNKPSNTNHSERTEIVDFAKKYIGTKYKWAGTTPSGFDCSGYTGYVLNNFKIALPRRAADQYSKSKKIKLKKVQPGDLVFFGSKSNISHVGIIVSNENNQPIMIHSSTSKGIILTDIFKSSYWKNKVHGYGTYIEKSK